MTLSLPTEGTITRAELPNGLTTLIYGNHASPSVVIGGYLWAGSLSERPEQAGLASFAAGMLLRGTEMRSFRQINEALESVGAQLSFYGGMHTVGFGGKALAKDLDLLLEILAESLQFPTFPAEQVDRLQGQILTGLQRRAHNTRRMARLTFDELLFPDHPYGRSVQGYEETVSVLGRDDLVGYHQNQYSPEGMVLAIVGAVHPAQGLRKVQAKLGAWQAPGAKPHRGIPAGVRLLESRHQQVTIEGKTQTDIVLGWPALSRRDPDYMKAHLANTILGVFGMMGRLGDNVRDQQGLAYYVYSQLEAGLGVGPWLAIAGVGPANVERAVEGILHEVRRLRDEPVPADELADSQSFLTGSMPLRLETNEGVARVLLEIERHHLGLDYLERYPNLVHAVTVQDVQDVVQKYLDPEVYALAIAGPRTR
jgi:zinc protease